MMIIMFYMRINVVILRIVVGREARWNYTIFYEVNPRLFELVCLALFNGMTKKKNFQRPTDQIWLLQFNIKLLLTRQLY